MPFLGEIPLNSAIREGGDNGTPLLVSNPAAPESEAFDKGVEEIRMRRHRERRLAGRRFAAARKIGDQDSAMLAERRGPGVEVLERPDEAVTQKQRVARSLVEVPDPPLPNVDELDVLGGDRRCYSPVSIWARCSRPL